MSENKSINAALLEAQKKIGVAIKDTKNSYFKTGYASLEAVLLAVKAHLNESGIFITQPIEMRGEAWCVATRLVHAESGESVESAMPIVSEDMGDPQKWGSAITYARRYTLQSLVSLPAAKEEDVKTYDDDDGNSAANRHKKKDIQPPKTQYSQPRPQQKPKTQDETVLQKAKDSLKNTAKKYGMLKNKDIAEYAVALAIEKPITEMDAKELNTLEGKIILNHQPPKKENDNG